MSETKVNANTVQNISFAIAPTVRQIPNGVTGDYVFTSLINSGVKMLVTMGHFGKVEDVAEAFGYTPQQLKNYMCGRTPITYALFLEITNKIAWVNSKFAYRFIVDQLFPHLHEVR